MGLEVNPDERHRHEAVGHAGLLHAGVQLGEHILGVALLDGVEAHVAGHPGHQQGCRHAFPRDVSHHHHHAAVRLLDEIV